MEMRIVFAIILFLHALIHLMGVIKAFGSGNIPQLSRHISKPEGVLWMLCMLLLVTTFVLYLRENDLWPTLAIAGAILSQLLISLNWKDAKFGTFPNLLIVGISISSL